ncbi:MAG: 50S ribosomal protein L25 [Dehalococcoidales bacterium]|nr:MAG: 50S ribosomal protein L25 [Dehalococcoidales bacterium]
MEQIELQAAKRDVLGKKVRFLRRQGITPVHVFGHGIESLALQCDTANLQRVLARSGQTRIINLKIDDEKSPRTVMAREVQQNILKGSLLHVDFYQVKMTEVIDVEVPIVLVGEAPALKNKEYMLAQELNTLSIQCLPANIPDSIEVDVNSLTEADQAIRVRDIVPDEGVTILNDPEVMLARIAVQRVVEEEVPIAAEVTEEEVAEAAEAEEEAKPSEAPDSSGTS